MCKANDVYIPVLVGDEISQIMELPREEPVDETPLIQQEEEEDDDGCDVVTWMILLGGLLILIVMATMPCSCALVDGIEKEGNALLRGASNLLHKDSPSASIPSNADTRLQPSEMKPIFTTKITHEFEEEESPPSSEDTSEDFHVYSELPKDDEEFHVYSGLPKDDDGFDLPLVEESDADDDELTDEEEEESRLSIDHNMKARQTRNPSKDGSAPHHIFSTTWVDHFFISDSGSKDQAQSELLESKDTSVIAATEDASSHEIHDSKDDAARATESSSGIETRDEASPKSYSISYDEVFEAAPTDDDGVVILEPAVRRKLDTV